MTALQIPADLLPADGRFGCGPSKITLAYAGLVFAVNRLTGGKNEVAE